VTMKKSAVCRHPVRKDHS